ncbi:UNKNOWN [Stylonychia lemnae]|uniref:Uncharacterized protein n=1 Tax=Stylonychia lemnae TaxID=5949 RepID=A0A077ZW05_STYLE|nr:UNKNOWN [Stylonychia lemnae]|eukprot:CDW73771.1 UNKNOWN [Stylonychia lemnae]
MMNYNLRLKVQPCYPKKLVEEYMNKFQIQAEKNNADASKSQVSKSQIKNNEASRTFENDQKKIAFFLSHSKIVQEEDKRNSDRLIKRRENIQKQLNAQLDEAQKQILSEFSYQVFPSKDQMKEIRKEMKKMDSVNSERILYNVKFNQKVEKFKPVKISDDIKMYKQMYHERFLSTLNEDKDSDNDEEDESYHEDQDYQKSKVQGIRDFPNFLKLKTARFSSGLLKPLNNRPTEAKTHRNL